MAVQFFFYNMTHNKEKMAKEDENVFLSIHENTIFIYLKKKLIN